MSKRVLTGVIAAVVLAVSAPSAANADAGNPFDINTLVGANHRVISGSCRDIVVTARTNAAWDYQDISASVDVWRGATNVGTADLERVAGTSLLRGSYFYCPGLDDVGTFRLGDTSVDWGQYDNDFNYYNSGSFLDTSRGRMVVKQGSYVTLTATRKGMKRTFRAHAAYFPAGTSSWSHFPKGIAIALQRQGASGKWAWVRSAKTDRKGNAKLVVKRAGTYRAVSPTTTRTWGATSRALTR